MLFCLGEVNVEWEGKEFGLYIEGFEGLLKF